MQGKTNNKLNMTSKVLLFMCALTLTVSCAAPKHEKKSENIIVNVATATNMASVNQKEFSFISKPFRTSDLSFRVGGPITIIYPQKTDHLLSQINSDMVKYFILISCY